MEPKGVGSHHVVLLNPKLAAHMGCRCLNEAEHLALDAASDAAGEIRAPANAHRARDVSPGLVQGQRDREGVVLPRRRARPGACDMGIRRIERGLSCFPSTTAANQSSDEQREKRYRSRLHNSGLLLTAERADPRMQPVAEVRGDHDFGRLTFTRSWPRHRLSRVATGFST